MADIPEPRWSFRLARHTAIVSCVVLAFVILVMILWLASTAVMAFGVGIVLAVVLDAGARGLAYVLPFGRRSRLGIVLLLAVVFIAAAVWWGGATLASQFNEFMFALQKLGNQAEGFMKNSRFFSGDGSLKSIMPSPDTILGGATSVLPLAFSSVSIAVAIVFIGPFLAWEPKVYKRTILSILPRESRPRVDVVLDRAGMAMRHWVLGQSISMIAIFLFSLCALTIIGMPYGVLLAVQAGLLTFIPTLGPFVAGVVIVLAGLSQSFTMALYGLATYILIQFLETHLVTPVVQERTVHMPPAITLGLQLVAGFLFGLLGLAFVVPLAAAGKTLIEELYVNDYLGGGWDNRDDSDRSWLSRFADRFLPR